MTKNYFKFSGLSKSTINAWTEIMQEVKRAPVCIDTPDWTFTLAQYDTTEPGHYSTHLIGQHKEQDHQKLHVNFYHTQDFADIYLSAIAPMSRLVETFLIYNNQ